jgi:hypothetical protein
VLEDAGDVVLALGGQVVLVVGVVEDVLALLEQGLVAVHDRAVLPKMGLGMKVA